MPITPKPLQIEVFCRKCGTYLYARWDTHTPGHPEISLEEPCQCPLNEIRKVYERYKGNAFNVPLMVLWQTIKATLEPEEDNNDENR